jgi:ElaB/YqjD/DUF883 family membrane-anchored ribosome-binding protein
MPARIEEFREQAAVVGQGLAGLAATAGAVATDRIHPVENYVQANPVKSILIAAGIGALLGMVCLRR